jgi:hypothetical protein
MILTAGRMSFAFARKQFPALSITALGRLQRGADNSGLDFLDTFLSRKKYHHSSLCQSEKFHLLKVFIF